jgi:ribosomal protein S18 acetylase RimI-like enzyme
VDPLLRIEPASDRTLAELAALFTAGYEEYFVPVVVDEAAFRFMVETFDDDLDASRVAVLDGEPVGLCKVAIRGDQGWVGGLGVTLPHRNKGIGAVLMRRTIEELRARGVRRLWLEVLVQNEPAVRLYERLGFAHVRGLEIWTLEEIGSERHDLPRLPLGEALGREDRPPWQRADASVARLAGVEAIGDERGSLVYRVADGTASLLQCAATDVDAARALLRALPPGVEGARWVNGPEGHPLNEALGALGGTCGNRQYEMVLAL